MRHGFMVSCRSCATLVARYDEERVTQQISHAAYADHRPLVGEDSSNLAAALSKKKREEYYKNNSTPRNKYAGDMLKTL